VVAPAEIRIGEKGRAALEVKLVFGESTVTSAFATSPMKLLTPRSRGQSVWACTSSFGGGLVAGDETQLDLKLGANTRCFVGTQASTKVYRNPSRRPCGHRTQATLEADSLLVFAPDPVQAFANSSYTQRQEFQLAPGAGLAFVDWFSSGRVARDERWDFDHFQSRNDVFIAGERVFVDSILLSPDDGSLTTQHRAGHFNCFAMLLLIGPPMQEAAQRLLQEISARLVERGGKLVCSASPVRDGALLRIAGESVEQVGREPQRHLQCLSSLLGDNPWARKW
jgi:urease accessory protein